MPRYVQTFLYAMGLLVLLALLPSWKSHVPAWGKQGNGKVPAGLSAAESEVLAGADARIRKYRTASATLEFVTGEGKPVSDAVVLVEQANHEFLFGGNHSIRVWSALAQEGEPYPADRWSAAQRARMTEDQLEALEERFYEFANYTSLPVGWPFYEPKEGVIALSRYDEMLDRLHARGIKVLAHNLVWNSNTPAWVPNDCRGISRAIEKRVGDFMTHFRGKFDCYLVFNEPSNPFRPNFKKDKMTKCFTEFGKAQFVTMPFRRAREINPEAKLLINEVSVLEHQGFPELLRNLKDPGGKPYYDAIGIQLHMHGSLWPLDGVWKLCEGYGGFAVPIQITELTVLSGTPVSGKSFGTVTTPEGERLQAEYVVNLYTLLFSHPAVEAILWWNLSDMMAWRDAPAGLLRSDMSPKPAYTELLNLIKKKWWTRAETRTGNDGQCGFTGFFGRYKITVAQKDGAVRTYSLYLGRKGARHFRFIVP